MQKYQDFLRYLEKLAKAGKSKLWNAELSTLYQLAREVKIDPKNNPGLQVQIEKMELDLFFTARKKRLKYSQEIQREVVKTKHSNETDKAEKLLEQRERLNQTAAWLKGQFVTVE